MITRLKRLGKLPDTLSALRTKAVFNSYSKNGGANLYRVSVNRKAVGVISQCGGFNLTAVGDIDGSELDSFFGMLSAEVFTEAETAEKLSPKAKEEVSIMMLTSLYGDGDTEVIGNCRRLYDTLFCGTDGDIALPPFDDFYADLMIRRNHGSAEWFLSENAAAVSLFVTDGGALVTGVAVPTEKRKKGYGSAVLSGLIKKIKNTRGDIPIYAAVSEKNIKFYEKNGFVKVKEAAVLYY